MKKDRSDFRNWLSFNVNWKEVAFLVNTGKEYQHKQDLIAVFWNGYIYYRQKFEGYFKEFNKIPSEVFRELIFEFRQSFPKNGRVNGVNYFDDLLEQLLEHYSIEQKEENKIKEIEKTAFRIVDMLNFEKAADIICEGLSSRMPGILERIKNLEDLSENDRKEFESYEGLAKQEIIQKERNKISSERDKIINAYTAHFKKLDEKVVDPEFTKDEFKATVYNTILEHEGHFKTFRQFPSDWNNVELFGRLWGEAILVMNWSKPVEITTIGDSYKISNLLKSNMQIENPFLKNDSWTKVGKQRGTDFIRMILENISKLKIEGTAQNYLLIARAHDVLVSDKSIRNVMKEGRNVELKRNKSGT